jgi:ArsR family transcriptional regulator
LRFEVASSLLPAIECCGPLVARTLSDEEEQATADVFAALAHPARVRIVNLLASSAEPVCLCNLVEPVGLAQATVSQHLKKLVDAGLLMREERGKWSYFSLDREAMARVASLADMRRREQAA